MRDEIELMKRLEGMMTTSYDCTSGKRTVGIGFNMDAIGARKVWDKLQILEDFDAVYNKKQKLSEESASRLFDKTWNWCKKKAEERCAELGVDWEPMAAWHKFVLADIVYNTGSISKWSKVVKETAPGRVLIEARRRPHEIMDSRISKTAKYFGFIDTVEDAVAMGLKYAKYI